MEHLFSSFSSEHVSSSLPSLLFGGMEKLIAQARNIVFLKDADLKYVAASPAMVALAGKTSAAELLGRTDLEVFDDFALAQRYMADDRRVLSLGEDLVDYVEPLQSENGEARYASTSKYCIRDNEGKVVGVLGVCRDVTRQIRAREQYESVVQYLFTLPENTYTAVLIDVDAWRIIAHRKQEFLDQLMPDYVSVEQFQADVLSVLADQQSEAYRFYENLSADSFRSIYQQGKYEFQLEHQNIPPDGSSFWSKDEWRFLVDPDSGHLTVMLLVQDIDDKKQAENKLMQAAQLDELTGLYNRATVKDRVKTYLEGEGATGTHAAFMIDLDDFKLVNDTFGHQAGDLLLYEVAASLKDCFRDIDIVGRMGGDEFFVFAKNLSSRNIASARAKRLLEAVRKVYASQTTAIGSISIGIAMYPKDGGTMDQLYKKADEALYKAKTSGKNRAAFASDDAATDWSVNAFDRQYEAYNSQVLDHSSTPCYIADLETYELLHMTKGSMELHGLKSPEEYRGKKCYQTVMGLDAPCPFCPSKKLVEGESYNWERYNDKLNRWFERTSSLIHLNGRPCHLGTAHDITDRKEAIDLLSGQLSMEDLMFQCLHILASEENTEAAFRRFLEAIAGFYQGNRAYIFEFDLVKQELSNSFEWCAEGVSAEIDNLQNLPLELVEGWIRKFHSHGEFSISSLDDELDPETDEYKILEMQGIQSLMAAPLWRSGQVIGFIGVDDPVQNLGNLTLLRSVSEFVQAELEQRKLADGRAAALQQAELANLSKSKFLFNMSHDIRTPMNAILGFAMLAKNHLDDKERVLDSLNKLESAGKHLLRLINDVLDMSRIESGKMSFDLQPHHLPTVLKDTFGMFNPEMQKKDIEFTVSCEVEHEFVLMDRLRIDQVELNLLSNALKYTPEGGKVHYSIRELSATEDTATYRVSVKDTGIGMSKEFAAKVFEPFEREKTSTVDGIQGTGLGLSIVKSLIEQMGGSISCESEQGVGSEFVVLVTLPTTTEDAMPKKVDELASKASFTEKRILLVEDNELNREIAVEILEEFGFIMESAEDGDIAVDMVTKSEPGYYDLILMDIQMPRMNGYDATRAIRSLADQRLANIPIIAMTANAFAEDRKNAMAVGMNEHIAKPIDVPKLIETLQRIL